MIKRITISLALAIFLGFVPQAFADDGSNDGEVQSSSFSHEHEKLTEGGLFTAFLKCALTRGFTGRHAVCE